MLRRPHHPVPDPGPELVGGGPGEGDDQQLRGRGPTLGDEPGGQVGQGVGLAGSGAGLDGQLAAGKGVGQVEPGCGSSVGISGPGRPVGGRTPSSVVRGAVVDWSMVRWR